MVKFLVKGVYIVMDTDNAEIFTGLIYEGSPKDVEVVKNKIESSYGLFGKSIDELSPAIDIKAALGSLKRRLGWDYEVVEGQDILDRWVQPKFPEGVMY